LAEILSRDLDRVVNYTGLNRPARDLHRSKYGELVSQSCLRSARPPRILIKQDDNSWKLGNYSCVTPNSGELTPCSTLPASKSVKSPLPCASPNPSQGRA
jgi:hypothetical protein